MFKKAATEKFWMPVVIEYQREEGGRGTVSFDVQCKRLTPEQLRTLIQDVEDLDDADLKFMQAVATDWRKVPDDEGGEVPFSQEALREFHSLGFARPTVITYVRTYAKAKEKN